MRTAKNDRQEMLIKLIKENEIATQDDLTSLMKANGFNVTQATCSRDIKDLGIIKVTLPNNGTKYAVPEKTGSVAPGRLLAVFTNSLISCRNAMNTVVIKTLPGMAQAAASALDSLHFPQIIGSIAGDDTVFAVTGNVEDAEALVETIDDMMKRGNTGL